MPDDCSRREPHAPLVIGGEIRTALKRQRAATDRANDRVIRCALVAQELINGVWAGQ